MTLSEKIWNSSIGAFIAYGKTAAAAALKPLLVTDNGDGTGTLVVSAASSALPTGAATSANQTALIAKIPDQSGGKVPVVMASETDIGTMQDDIALIKADIITIKGAISGSEAQVDVVSLPATPAGTALIGKVGIDQTTPGTTNGIQVKFVRQASSVHRNGITSADKLTPPTLAAKADVATGGALLANTTYYTCVCPNTALGPCTISNILSQATASDASNTHCIDLTIPQVTNAVSYGIFCSSAAAPLWVAKITEVQRSAGCKITAVGTVESPSAGVSAGVVRIGAVGTGLATSATQFAANNAYVTSGLTGIVCSGYNRIYWHVILSLTDLRSAPALTLCTILEDDQGTQYIAGVNTVFVAAGGVGQGFNQVFYTDVCGAAKAYCLVGSISGQGAACTIRTELA